MLGTAVRVGAARVLNQFCQLIDLIAVTRKLAGDFPVDNATNP